MRSVQKTTTAQNSKMESWFQRSTNRPTTSISKSVKNVFPIPRSAVGGTRLDGMLKRLISALQAPSTTSLPLRKLPYKKQQQVVRVCTRTSLPPFQAILALPEPSHPSPLLVHPNSLLYRTSPAFKWTYRRRTATRSKQTTSLTCLKNTSTSS